MNRDAMSLPAEKLLASLQERAQRRADVLAERDHRLGVDRTRINSYMENIGWPDLFGYDMNDFFTDADLALELTLRQTIFWLDNVDHDYNVEHLSVEAGRSYWDIALFGQEIGYDRQGVPQFAPHPIAQRADLALLQPFEFGTTGAMPGLLRMYADLRRIATTRYGGQIEVNLPRFARGPLDILVQLRGYERVVQDMLDSPDFVRGFVSFVVEQRLRFERERISYLGLEELPETSFLADDWLNVPFLSPWMYREFVKPAYESIQNNEGRITGYHTCGGYGSLATALYETLPGLQAIDIVPQCNDLVQLDEALPASVAFNLNLLSVFTLKAPEDEERRLLRTVAEIGRRRKVVLCPGAIVRLHDTYDEDIARLNRFIALARGIFSA